MWLIKKNPLTPIYNTSFLFGYYPCFLGLISYEGYSCRHIYEHLDISIKGAQHGDQDGSAAITAWGPKTGQGRNQDKDNEKLRAGPG